MSSVLSGLNSRVEIRFSWKIIASFDKLKCLLTHFSSINVSRSWHFFPRKFNVRMNDNLKNQPFFTPSIGASVSFESKCSASNLLRPLPLKSNENDADIQIDQMDIYSLDQFSTKLAGPSTVIIHIIDILLAETATSILLTLCRSHPIHTGWKIHDNQMCKKYLNLNINYLLLHTPQDFLQKAIMKFRWAELVQCP